MILNALIALCVCLPAVDQKQPVAPSVQNSPIVVVAESDDAAEELETAETAHRGHHHHHHHHHGHGHGYGHGFGGGYGYPVHRGYGGGGFGGGGVGVGVGVAVGVGVGGFHGRK